MTTFKYIKSLFVILTLAMPALVWAQTFEGVIEVTSTNGETGETAKVKWLIKNGNDKLVVNTTYAKGTTEYSVIMPKGQNAKFISGGMAFDISTSQLKGASPQMGNVTVRKVEGEKTINGYKCYLVKDDRNMFTAWLTDEAGISLTDLPQLMQDGMLKPLIKSGITGIPLELTGYDEHGKLVMNQNITAITAMTINDSEFNVSGYPDGNAALSGQTGSPKK